VLAPEGVDSTGGYQTRRRIGADCHGAPRQSSAQRTARRAVPDALPDVERDIVRGLWERGGGGRWREQGGSRPRRRMTRCVLARLEDRSPHPRCRRSSRTIVQQRGPSSAHTSRGEGQIIALEARSGRASSSTASAARSVSLTSEGRILDAAGVAIIARLGAAQAMNRRVRGSPRLRAV